MLLLLSPLLLLLSPLLLGIFSEFPFAMYANNHKNHFTSLKCKLPQEGKVDDLEHNVYIRWEKTRQVCKIQCPLCYFMSRLLPPCPLCYSPFSLFIPFNHDNFLIIVYRSILPITCSLKCGVSCFIVVYLPFASDKRVNFRDAWWKKLPPIIHF